MDVLARSLKRAGHEVWSAITTDGFENHVVVKALSLGEDPAAVARSYHLQIGADLSAIDIHFDRFDDPAQPDHIEAFESVKDDLLSGLAADGQVRLREERLPVDDAQPDGAPIEERFAIGGWFAGRCPCCGAPAGSFFCEACGAHFEPYEAHEPSSRRGTITHWPANRSFFLALASDRALPRLWREMMVETPFTGVAQRHLDASGPSMRLSLPGRYGLRWRSDALINQQICFSYSSLLYAHHLYCGAQYARETSSANPFTADSDRLLLCSTGLDNTIPVLVGVSGCALVHPGFRPFDRAFFNYFLRLEGKKFSTSSGHVIWAGEIAEVDGLNVDLLRTYLSEICPEERETDLRVEDLVERHNGLLAILRRRVEAALACVGAAPSQTGFSDGLLGRLDVLYGEQSKALSIDRLRVSHASDPVTSWLEEADSPESPAVAYTWLKGLAFLAAPLMPSLAEALWQRLGHDRAPTCEEFLRQPALRPDLPVKVSGHALRPADVEACIARGVAR
jgi:methionyl-tRNA synthetase